MRRLIVVVLIVLVLGAAVILGWHRVVPVAAATDPVPPDRPPPPHPAASKLELSRRYARKLERRLAEVRRQTRRIASTRPSVRRTIALAAVAYGQSATTLIRKAECESRLWPYARNPSSGAAGLFQFLPSTWESTPYASYSVYDPQASALAAAWMHARGRGGEWVCR